MIDFAKLLEGLKLKPRYLLGLALLSASLLFMPASLIQTLGLGPLGAQYRPWIGAIFLVSTVLLLAHGLAHAGNALVATWKGRVARRRREKELCVLSPPEAKLLNQYLSRQTTTLKLNSEDGIVNGLIARGFLYPGAQYAKSEAGSEFLIDVNLQPWVWKYLREHTEVLALAQLKSTRRRAGAQTIEEPE